MVMVWVRAALLKADGRRPTFTATMVEVWLRLWFWFGLGLLNARPCLPEAPRLQV